MKLKKGDNVIILSGKDKGSTGKVIEVHPKTDKVVVDGLNQVTVHKKPTNTNSQGGRFKEFHAINASKVGITHPSKKGKASRIGYKIDAKGNKKRIYKANGKEV